MNGLDMRGWIGTGEAGRRLGIHPVNVARLIAQGKIRAERVAGRWLVDPASVETLRREREARRQPKPDDAPADLAAVL